MFLFCSLLARAQKGGITTAASYFTQGKLDKAKEIVDAIVKDEDGANMIKAQFLRGQVYQAIFESQNADYKKLSSNPLDVAWKAFKEVIRLDRRRRFEKELRTQFYNLLIDFMNQGDAHFRNRNPKEALEYFKWALEINQSPYGTNKVDTMVIYNAAVSAQQAGMWTEAVTYYKQALELNYKPLRTYSMLAKILLEQGRSNEEINEGEKMEKEGVAYLLEGYRKFPGDQYLLVELVNYYLYANELDSVLLYIEKAIELNPGNAEYYRVEGTVYEQLGNDEMAESRYLKALELDSTDFISQYNMGNIRLNRVIKEHEALLALNDLITYNMKIGEVMAQYEAVIPLFERALELKPNDRNTCSTLSQLYFRLRNKPNSSYLYKYEQMQQILEN
ncbi:MAG: tetratricopeptide repeat protein [Odoribacteraceae bacterium]|nr:tetratricopeptide repeat protein [Odoribacteraceae bacterium]